MMEKRLQTAAEALPEHTGDFSAVKNRISEKSHRPLRRKRLAIAMVMVVLLVGCVAVSTPDYHLYNGNWWSFVFDMDEILDMTDYDWNQTQTAAKKLGITLPQTLGGYPVIDYGRWNLTNQEVPIWFAWLSPRYVYQYSFYGYDTEIPWTSPDGTESTLHTSVGANVAYGPMDDEIWRRQFGFDESDVYTAADYTLANHPVEEITSQEYEGITIYVARIGIYFLDLPKWTVTWVDHNNGVVFSLDGDFEAPDDLLDYAQEIIDLNR